MLIGWEIYILMVHNARELPEKFKLQRLKKLNCGFIVATFLKSKNNFNSPGTL